MADDSKEPVNFRLGRNFKASLERLASERDKPVGQLVREVVEDYVMAEERAAWEAAARRSAREVAEAARDPQSDESEMLRTVDANLKAFAEEWVWKEG